MNRSLRGALLALCLVMSTGCSAGSSDAGAKARSTESGSVTISRSVTTQRESPAAVLDKRGESIVHLTIADNGSSVLVDLGQLLELRLGGSTSWLPPSLVESGLVTGQDRVLYLQESSGYPAHDTAYARLRTGNPGDALLVSREARPHCPSSCRGKTFRVRIYVNTRPSP